MKTFIKLATYLKRYGVDTHYTKLERRGVILRSLRHHIKVKQLK